MLILKHGIISEFIELNRVILTELFIENMPKCCECHVSTKGKFFSTSQTCKNVQVENNSCATRRRNFSPLITCLTSHFLWPIEDHGEFPGYFWSHCLHYMDRLTGRPKQTDGQVQPISKSLDLFLIIISCVCTRI